MLFGDAEEVSQPLFRGGLVLALFVVCMPVLGLYAEGELVGLGDGGEDQCHPVGIVPVDVRWDVEYELHGLRPRKNLSSSMPAQTPITAAPTGGSIARTVEATLVRGRGLSPLDRQTSSSFAFSESTFRRGILGLLCGVVVVCFWLMCGTSLAKRV
jgi:hypothetical protein